MRDCFLFFHFALSFAQDAEAPFVAAQEEGEQVMPSERGVQEEDLPSSELPFQPLKKNDPSLAGEGLSPPWKEPYRFVDRNPLSFGCGNYAAIGAPVPPELPPFMLRPSEWETTPPTVAEAPPLPAAALFSGRELAAFQFIEEGKESFDHESWEQAKEPFERAISIAPFLPYSYYFLGRIAFAHGDHKHALAWLQKAELLFPRTERAWLGETTSIKGVVYEDLNDYKQARTAYQRSLRFQPANLKVLSALARLPEEEPPPSDAIVQ
jgi:tetratricopeptide (TPR) repeat protein